MTENKTYLKTPSYGISNYGLTIKAEQALDKYVKFWNAIQTLNENNIKISWFPNPNIHGGFYFKSYIKE